ncbi:MAG: DUF218 domain-containing protein [Geobacteraceae bacterium]|nr:DUF218 domain-containing protein [Geobacteraceae bacterium]
MKKNNVVIISSVDWATHWQMHHELASLMVAAGNRVLFIENTGVRKPQIKDIGRIRDRIRNRLRSEHGFSQMNEGVYLYSPLFIPLPYSRIANFVNVLSISTAIRRWMRLLRFSDPVVISFLPTPLAQGLINKLNSSLTVYYCANHMAGASSATAPLRVWEDKFFSSADLVFSISEAIAERAQPFSRYIYFFPAGVDLGKFVKSQANLVRPADVAEINCRIIGYVGAISDVFDKTQIIELSKALPDTMILLVGPKYTDTSSLEDIPNVRLLGERAHDQIPAYINSFDVALIPYLVNEFTDSVYSCKLTEYLAMGVPVVSSNMREVRVFLENYPETVLIGQSHDDFTAKVKLALDDPQIRSQEMFEKRIAVARENTWEKRFSGIMEVIDRHLQLKSAREVSWKESLAKYYKRSRARLVSVASVVLALYLLVFNTPFVWFVGDQLVVRHLPRKTDAIVVFSGNGESSYRNDSYQRRALDAVRFYRKGYASHIFLSSGRNQDISEVEVIKLYLEDKGVAKSAIHILDKFPGSTRENVQMVTQQLRQEGIHSILFLTAPYHGRRALWTWKKQTPDITVLTPSVVDTPADTPQWSASVDQIRVISYEYAAILYNWLRGWL